MFYKAWFSLCTAPHGYSWRDEAGHGPLLHPGVASTCDSCTPFRKNSPRRCAHHMLGPIMPGPTCPGSCGLDGSLLILQPGGMGELQLVQRGQNETQPVWGQLLGKVLSCPAGRRMRKGCWLPAVPPAPTPRLPCVPVSQWLLQLPAAVCGSVLPCAIPQCAHPMDRHSWAEPHSTKAMKNC